MKNQLVKVRNAFRNYGKLRAMIQYIGVGGEGGGYAIAYGSSSRAMRENLMWSESGINIRWHARRAARANEYIGRFLERAVQTAVFDNRVETPVFPGVPAEIAKYVALMWAAWWMNGTDSRGRLLMEAERLHIYDWLVDGEIFFDWKKGTSLRPIPADMIKDHVVAVGDYMVAEWVGPKGATLSADELLQVAIIQSNWQLRGKSYLAKALPEVFANMEYRDNSAQSIRDLSKIAAVTENSATGSAHGLPGGGAQSFDQLAAESGEVVGTGAGDPRFRNTPAGWVADLKMGEKLSVANYGPPAEAVLRADAQPAAIAIALGVSETELTGDHVKHNFASLQVAEVRDMKTYMGIRQKWYTGFRAPVFRHWLDMAIASGELPGTIVKYYTALKPRWSGPKIITAQPLKDAQATKLNAELGQVSLRRLGASQGENAERNAIENAEIMKHSGGASGAAPPVDLKELIAEAIDNAK